MNYILITIPQSSLAIYAGDYWGIVKCYKIDDVYITIVDIFIVSDRSSGGRRCCSLGLKPLFSYHLTDRIINRLHRVTVCVCHLLETTVAVLVIVLNESLILTLDTDGLKIMECIVCKSILHTVASNDFSHKKTPHLIRSAENIGFWYQKDFRN